MYVALIAQMTHNDCLYYFTGSLVEYDIARVDGEKFALDYISSESDETVWPGESEYLYNLTVPGLSLTWLTASPKPIGGLLIKLITSV